MVSIIHNSSMIRQSKKEVVSFIKNSARWWPYNFLWMLSFSSRVKSSGVLNFSLTLFKRLPKISMETLAIHSSPDEMSMAFSLSSSSLPLVVEGGWVPPYLMSGRATFAHYSCLFPLRLFLPPSICVGGASSVHVSLVSHSFIIKTFSLLSRCHGLRNSLMLGVALNNLFTNLSHSCKLKYFTFL